MKPGRSWRINKLINFAVDGAARASLQSGVSHFPLDAGLPRKTVKHGTMFTDQFKHDINTFLQGQGDRLFARQKSVFDATYKPRTGSLSRALSDRPAINVSDRGFSIEVAYPIHIRFLDMKKRWSKKKERMVRKKKYAPIYNKYVYGYLKSGILNRLNEFIPRVMIRAIEDNFKSVK